MRLYFSDGTFEDFCYISVESDRDELQADICQFGAVLREKLGVDAEQWFYGFVEASRQDVENYYTDGDGAVDDDSRELLIDAMNTAEETHKAIDKMLAGKISRIQLQDISKRLRALQREIYNNL